MDSRKWFMDSDEEDLQQQEEQIKPQVNAKSSTLNLYQLNLNKYISYLKDISTEWENKQQALFQDGICHVSHDLIRVTQINYEKNIGIFDIIEQLKNKPGHDFNRTMVIFTFLDNQVSKVMEIFQSSFYDNLLMYGEIPKMSGQESPELMTSRVLQIYKKIYDLVRKLMSYVQNLVLQLHSIINRKQQQWKTIFRTANMDFAFQTLSKALRAIYTIDCIVQNNVNILSHWDSYLKLISLAKKQPTKFQTSMQNIKKLQKTLNKLTNTILSCKCMQMVIGIQFDQQFQKSKNPLGSIKNNKDLRQYFQVYLTRKHDQINNNLGTKNQNEQSNKILGLLCLYALFRRLYPSEEGRQFWKRMWAIQKKVPLIQVHSFVCIYTASFLTDVSPLAKKSRTMDPKDESAFIKMYIQKLPQNISVQFVSFYAKFCVWLSRMQSVATSNHSLRQLRKQQKSKRIISQRVSNRITLLVEGVTMVMKMNQLLYICLMLHINLNQPISTKLLGNMILVMETVKAVSSFIKKKSEAFDTMVLSRVVSRDMIAILSPAYKKVMNGDSKKLLSIVDRIEAIKTILKLLQTPISQLKITIIKYSLTFISNDDFLSKEQINHLYLLIRKLQIICYYPIYLQKYSSCEFLYSCKDILPKIFEYKQENPNTCKRLQFLFDTFEDSAYLIHKCQHLERREQLFMEYKQSILKTFEESYMVPLKRRVEDFLRISTHVMLIEKLQGVNPFNMEMSDLTKLIQLEKLRVFDVMVDIRLQISRSFNQTFYNMNVLNMHDMETYEQMRILGNHLFGLNLHDVFLPSQTIEQNKFDILQIIRNIPAFIPAYKYNLLSQKFLEITKQGKIINSIGIQQLSDSIRTHGLGILPTTVNAFYKFLVTKVQAFNKFLYDDYIQSPLVKQKKWFKQYVNKQDYPGYYPFERAQHFYKQIKKLGKFQDQSNFLDKFRETITAVGNSLGFVRLLRSASLNSSSKSVEFLPKKIEIEMNFQQVSGKTLICESGKACCRQLDQILKSFDQKFSSKLDYLNLMIKLFAKLVTKENRHLKLFYFIIPSLTINYIENVAKGKEQINKKLSSNAFLYDDGFILGLSYFMSLLKQTEEYKTMHWDEATQAHFQKSINYSKQVSDAATNHSAMYKDNLNMQKQLLVKKLELMKDQFTLFNYNLTSANVLFQNSSTVVAPKSEQPASPPTTQENQQQTS